MRKRYAVLALLGVLGVILYIDRICISLALPDIQKELELEPEMLGWISVAFSISYALFEIPTGHLGDRYGGRRVLTRITLWWSAFTALTGAAFGFVSLLITRFLFGAGEAGAWPNASGVVSKWFPARDRGKAMGLFGAATQIGGGLSPMLVIPIQQAFGWRASFFVFAIAGAVWAAVWYAWFRNTPAEQGVSVEERAEIGETPPVATHGLPWRLALRQRSLWGLIWMDFANIYTAFFAVFWMPTYLKAGCGFTDGDLKWTAVVWIGGLVGNAIGGAISDRAVRRLGLRAGRRLVGISWMAVVVVALVIVTQGDKQTVLVALTIWGFAQGVIQANAFATCIDLGGSHVGSVAGAMNTAGQLGGALSALAFGYLVKLTDSYDAPMFVMAGVTAVGSLGWLIIDAARPLIPR